MWFTRQVFELCHALKEAGLQPRFEPGDIVARGFADLGFEEFQVLPGPKLLSLTAGTMTTLQDDHRHFFFWVPSVDETVELIEREGWVARMCERGDTREWRVEFVRRDAGNDASHTATSRSLHQALLEGLRRMTRSGAGEG